MVKQSVSCEKVLFESKKSVKAELQFFSGAICNADLYKLSYFPAQDRFAIKTEVRHGSALQKVSFKPRRNIKRIIIKNESI